jgi:hypothetical protein
MLLLLLLLHVHISCFCPVCSLQCVFWMKMMTAALDAHLPQAKAVHSCCQESGPALLLLLPARASALPQQHTEQQTLVVPSGSGCLVLLRQI